MKTLILALAAITTSCASLQSGDRQIAGKMSLMNRTQARVMEQYQMASEYEQAFETAKAYSIFGPEPRFCKYTSEIARANPPPAKTVTLTFDDGPSERNTPEVLRILKLYKIKATFFMQGVNAVRYPSIIKMVQDEGHIVANHSYHHPVFPQLSEEDQAKEIMTTDALLNPYMSADKPKLFRFPYGSSTCYAINYVVNEAKYYGSAGWHVDTCDWAYQKTGTVTSDNAIKNCEIKQENLSSYKGHVMDLIKRYNGGILLMHETNDRTVASLEDLIQSLIQEGYTFANLNDPALMDPTTGQNKYIKRAVPQEIMTQAIQLKQQTPTNVPVLPSAAPVPEN